MPFLRTIAYVLFTGYILCFFSEWMFWSGRPIDPGFLDGLLPTWLMYSFITFLFLAIVDYFRVRTIWAAFLAGAVYGWLLEGIIVQTTYDNFPLNISFTALAWHAPISIIFGWYVLPRLLRDEKSSFTRWCIGFGLCLGLWSIGWWTEAPVAPLESIVLYNFGFGIALVLAYVGQGRLAFKPNRFAVYLALALLMAYFVFVTLPTQPLALLVLPPLLVLTFIALRKNRLRESVNPTPLPDTTSPITLRRVIPLLFIPLTASLVYTAALVTGISLPTLQIAYFILMPAGFILFVVSLYKAWKGRGVQIAVNPIISVSDE